jgi:hypothetical protein
MLSDSIKKNVMNFVQSIKGSNGEPLKGVDDLDGCMQFLVKNAILLSQKIREDEECEKLLEYTCNIYAIRKNLFAVWISMSVSTIAGPIAFAILLIKPISKFYPAFVIGDPLLFLASAAIILIVLYRFRIACYNYGMAQRFCDANTLKQQPEKNIQQDLEEGKAVSELAH